MTNLYDKYIRRAAIAFAEWARRKRLAAMSDDELVAGIHAALDQMSANLRFGGQEQP